MGPTRGNGRKNLVSDINVTPMVDVMLVLLIIFMVTAPMMTQGLDVDLPETTTKSLQQQDKPLVVTVDKDGKISIGDDEVAGPMVFHDLDKRTSAEKEQPIYLKADRNVAYGVVVTLMADIKAAGFDKLGMITKPADNVK